MRSLLLVVAGTMIASCTMAPPLPTRTAESQRQFAQLLAGKAMQPPVSCLNTTLASSPEMRVIDEDTIAFRDGPNRVYVASTTGCTNLRPNGPYALVTEQHSGFGLCTGDIAKVQDLSTGVSVGSCAINGITEYRTPGR